MPKFVVIRALKLRPTLGGGEQGRPPSDRANGNTISLRCGGGAIAKGSGNTIRLRCVEVV
eukprot:644670-Amorphochlora_amoeboformis.AAC.1